MLEHIYAFNLCNASALCGIELYVAACAVWFLFLIKSMIYRNQCEDSCSPIQCGGTNS